MGFFLLPKATPCILFLALLSCTCFTSTGSPHYYFFPFFFLVYVFGYAVFCLRGCSVFLRCSTVSIFCGIHSILRGPYALLLAFEMKACERWNLCSLNLIKKVGFVRMWKLFFFFFIIC